GSQVCTAHPQCPSGRLSEATSQPPCNPGQLQSRQSRSRRSRIALVGFLDPQLTETIWPLIEGFARSHVRSCRAARDCTVRVRPPYWRRASTTWPLPRHPDERPVRARASVQDCTARQQVPFRQPIETIWRLRENPDVRPAHGDTPRPNCIERLNCPFALFGASNRS